MPGQLSLFKGKRQTGTKAPAASEFRLHCAIADTIRVGIAPGWIFWHTPNGELREKATAGRLKRMGVRPGVADILLLSPQGVLHALEIKARGEKPTEAQERFLGDVTSRGGKAMWCDLYDDAIHILKGWGAVRVSLS